MLICGIINLVFCWLRDIGFHKINDSIETAAIMCGKEERHCNLQYYFRLSGFCKSTNGV